MLTTEELNQISNTLYREYFNEEFPGWVEWSSRMKNIAGNCRNDGRIALNKHYYNYHGREETLKVLKHELCHLYCFMKIGRHDHSTPLFLESLSRMGGSLQGKAMPVTLYTYKCTRCDKEWSFLKELKKPLCCRKCSGGEFNIDYLVQLSATEIVEPE